MEAEAGGEDDGVFSSYTATYTQQFIPTCKSCLMCFATGELPGVSGLFCWHGSTVLEIRDLGSVGKPGTCPSREYGDTQRKPGVAKHRQWHGNHAQGCMRAFGGSF